MSIYGYRRGSIFWALTLIAVGAIFLWQNFNPVIHPWQIIAKYWPVLIIFWGLSKLVDYLQARLHPETTPPPLFSASEVVLLILILATGTLVSKIFLRPWQHWGNLEVDEDLSSLFLSPYTYTETISQAVKPELHLIVEDQRGDIEVRSANQSNIDVIAKKTIRAESEEAAKRIADQLKIEIVEQAGHYLLRSNRQSLPGGGHVGLDLVVRVPKTASTEITSERGDIILDGLRGDQTLTGLHGDVRLSGVEGLVRVHKTGGLTEIRGVKGSVELDGRGNDVEISDVTGTTTVTGEFSGSVQFRNLAQTLRYHSSRTDMTAQKLGGRLNMEVGSLDLTGIDGPFEISTRQKDITLNDFKHAVKIVSDNGDVQLRTTVPPTHPIQVELKKGQIELLLPAASNFQIDASSRHGEVDCDFSGPALKVVKEGENPSITGRFGKGGPEIRLGTEYGAIRVLHAGPRPPSLPAPPTKDTDQAWRSPSHSHPSAGLRTGSVCCEPAARLARWVAAFCRLQVRLSETLNREGTDWTWSCPRPLGHSF